MEITIFDGDFENDFFDRIITDKSIRFMDITNNDFRPKFLVQRCHLMES